MTLLARLFPDRWKPTVAELRHRRNWRRLPVARPTRGFVERHGLSVRAGPFRGMTYPKSAVGVTEQLVPKLLGSYERELHKALLEVTQGSYEQVVDIGASDGYYAVGLALALPDCIVHAYEMNPLIARTCAQLAVANRVDGRVRVHGEAGRDELRGLPSIPTLVFSDCEGCEATVLDPSEVPMLRDATVIVELHESLARGVEREIPKRFASTHRIEMVAQGLRHSGEYEELQDLDLDYIDRELLVSEFRPDPVTWAVMTPTRST